MSDYKPVSTESALKLGAELRRARVAKKDTLVSAAEKAKIDVGQLSRIERGQFKRISKNLQKYANYLQIALPASTDNLEERFRNFAARSAGHRAACELILDALEGLG
ncbi:helix-turn-helix domain-containing protein [Burkholderia ubonensis]|uniref:helix-turn-helix domain-containing protein n=1 Tax=Burkholderia ubonensis TaxID=101571 RepID=UPI0012FA37ED|nr:helix-turn-helix transcriptional regulator [Burkholderia ubonensis]